MCTQRTLVGSGGQVAGLPRVADRVEPHAAHVAVVVDRADRRRRSRDQPNRRAEPDERRQELVAVLRRAPRDDPRRHAQQLQRAGAVVRPTAGRRRPVGEDVATQVAEKRNHAPASIALRCTSARAHTARTNAAAKLGSEAPPHGRACGCRWPTSLVHQLGPVRIQPLVDAEAGQPRHDHLESKLGRVEHVLAAVAAAREQPVGEQHPEQRDEERAEQEEERLVVPQIDRQRARRRDGRRRRRRGSAAARAAAGSAG